MTLSDDAPRFRGRWSAPAAFLAAVAVTCVIAMVEVTVVSAVLGTGEIGPFLLILTEQILPVIALIVLGTATVFGLPTWTVMHLLRAVHPGQGALVGGVMGAMATCALCLLLFSGFPLAFALLGVPPGAAGGAICLWVAYRP